MSQSTETYDENHLLNCMIERLGLKNDAALSRALEVNQAVISKIRHRHAGVSGDLLIRMHELTELSIRDLRYLMGDNQPSRPMKKGVSPQGRLAA